MSALVKNMENSINKGSSINMENSINRRSGINMENSINRGSSINMENSLQVRKQVRRYYKSRRDALPLRVISQLSEQISGNILQWELYQKADAMFFYYPLGNEVSLLTVVKDAMAQRKHVAFPKAAGEDMEFYEITSLHELKEGCFHVMEPPADGRKPVCWEPSLCFVPGTAFDKSGGRMGYGRGYYDRYFTKRGGGKLAACAYDCQIADKIPMDAWDRWMDYLISENGIYDCTKDLAEPDDNLGEIEQEESV